MLKRNMKEVTEKSKAYHFRSVRKISKRDNQLRHVCLSIRLEQLGSHWTDFREIRYEYFSKVYKKNQSFTENWQE